MRNDKVGSRSSSWFRITCWFCKKQGHTRNDYYVRKKKYGEEAEAAILIDHDSEGDALLETYE